MARAVFMHALYGFTAYQEAGVCADAARHGLASGLFALFMCMLTNQLLAAWLKS